MNFKTVFGIGCFVSCILCVFVLTSLSSVNVSAGSVENDPSGDLEFSYYVSYPDQDNFDTGTLYAVSTPPLLHFRFTDIDSVDRIYWIRYDWEPSMIHDHDGDPYPEEKWLSCQEPFTITCSGKDVASGLAITVFDESTTYLYFDGNIEHQGLSGYQLCTISGCCPDNMLFGQNPVDPNCKSNLVCTTDRDLELVKDYGAVCTFYDRDRAMSYGSYWENRVVWDTINFSGNLLTNLSVHRINNGVPYTSSVYFHTYAEDYSSVDEDSDFGMVLYSRPIDVSIYDPVDKWHNVTLFSEYAFDDYIFGYVRDAVHGYLLSDVLVNLSISDFYSSFNTGGDGKYVFTDLTFDVSIGVLNASRDNYENFSLDIGLIDGGRYDIGLVGNVTVYSGTASIYGFVRDYDTLSLIDNALVRIEGNETEASTYTNEQGYFCFYNVTGIGTQVLSAQKLGYESGSSMVNVSVLDAKYSTVVYLLNESSMTTPDPGDGDEDESYNPFLILIDALGLGDYFDLIMALIIISILAGVMSYLTGGAVLATGIGALFGFLISCFAGFLPMWLIAVAILGSCAFFAMMVMKER